jgi:hypothetical protein
MERFVEPQGKKSLWIAVGFVTILCVAPLMRLGFYIRRPGKKFFVVGKVFKILWPEAAGFTVDGITVLTDTRFRNEKFVTKIRWFVVVKEGKDCCSCL